MVSAVQVGGKRLHDLARQGIEVEREPRPVSVHAFTVAATDDPLVLRADVRCSSGTYVRTLAADLGTALGGGAHLRNLRRSAIGSFTLDEAKPIEALSTDDVLPPAASLRDYDSVIVGPSVVTAISHGKVLPPDTLGVEGDGPWAVLDDSGTLLAVYERRDGDSVKPAVVLGVR
jgi:tRNA pseudouridine55 synthase